MLVYTQYTAVAGIFGRALAKTFATTHCRWFFVSKISSSCRAAQGKFVTIVTKSRKWRQSISREHPCRFLNKKKYIIHDCCQTLDFLSACQENRRSGKQKRFFLLAQRIKTDEKSYLRCCLVISYHCDI